MPASSRYRSAGPIGASDARWYVADERVVGDLGRRRGRRARRRVPSRGRSAARTRACVAATSSARPAGSGSSSGQSSTSASGYGSSGSHALTRMRRDPDGDERVPLLVERLDLDHLGDRADHRPLVAATGLAAVGDQRLTELGGPVVGRQSITIWR